VSRAGAYALVGGLITVIIVTAGLMLNVLPALALVLAALLVAAAVGGPTARAAFFALGLVLLFQSDAVPMAVRSAFLLVSVLLSVVSARNAVRAAALDATLARSVRLTLRAAVALCALVVIWIVGSLGAGAATEAVLRDATGYILLPLAVFIGLDFGLSAPRGRVLALVLGIGLLGGVSTTVAWLSRRGLEGGPEQFALASSYLAFPAVAAGLALFFSGTRFRVFWLLAGLVPAGVVVLSGGRQIVIILGAAVAAAVLVAGGPFWKRLIATVVAIAATVLGFTWVVELSGEVGGGIASDRFDFWRRVAESGLEVVANDASAIHRTRATEWMLQAWREHALVGQGLGQPLPSVRTGVPVAGQFTLDTPIVALAKFGALGALTIVLVLCIIVAAAWLLGARKGGALRTYIVCSVVMVVLTTFNGFPPENRGFPVFMLFFVSGAIALAPWRERQAISGGEDLGLPSRPILRKRHATLR
jgi:hypothetical protein